MTMVGNDIRNLILAGLLAATIPGAADARSMEDVEIVGPAPRGLTVERPSFLWRGPTWETLDPSTYRAIGDIRIGEAEVEPGWAGPLELMIPEPTWAMALAHSAKLLQVWGIDLNSNDLLAFAVEESALGCDAESEDIPYYPEVERNGCFNIDADFDFAELQALFPSRFSRSHGETVSGGRFEMSALAFAYLAAVHSAELDELGYDTASFYDGALDPDSLLKVVGVSHALGADNDHNERIFDTERDRCVDETNLAKDPVAQSCISNSGTSSYVRSVTDHAYALASPSAPIYDVDLSWVDVLAYLDTIAPMFPEASNSTVRAQVRAAFDSEAGSDGSLEFADGFGSVLDALILALPIPEDVEAAVAGR